MKKEEEWKKIKRKLIMSFKNKPRIKQELTLLNNKNLLNGGTKTNVPRRHQLLRRPKLNHLKMQLLRVLEKNSQISKRMK
jgi:hypothetical protein